MYENLSNFDPGFEKMKNSFKLQLIENGEVVEEVESENMVTDLAKVMAQAMYVTGHAGISMGSTGTYNNGFSSGAQLQLWDNTTTFKDNLFMNSNNGAMNLVGYNTNLGTTLSDSKTGAYLAAGSTMNKGGVTYTFEWATSQGNGTIKSLGFVATVQTMGNSNSLYAPYKGNVANLIGYQTYMGCNTVGSDKILYFRTWNVNGVNNITAIKETDFSTVEQLSLIISGGLNGGDTSICVYGDSLMVNNNIYTCTACNGTGITFKKAPKSTLVFGSPAAIAYTSIGAGTHYLNCLTSDDRYIYASICAATGSKSMLVTIDTHTDTVTSVVETTVSFGYSASVLGSGIKLSKCPFTADLILVRTASTYYDYLGQYTISTNKLVGGWVFMNTNGAQSCYDLAYVKSGACIIRSASNNAPIALTPKDTPQYPEKHCSTFFRVFGVNANVLTYAELPSPVTKTSSQSMRIQYTMQAM